MAPSARMLPHGAADGIDYRALFSPIVQKKGEIPIAEKYREFFGKTKLMDQINSVVQQANNGNLLPITDFGRERLSHDPFANGLTQKRFGVLSTIPWDLQPADMESAADKKIAADVCANVRRILSGIGDDAMGSAFSSLAWALFDGRGALEIQWQHFSGEKWPNRPVALDWIHPRMLGLGNAKELIAIDTFTAGFSWWGMNPSGIPLDNYPGKFIQWTPNYFGDYVEREGLLRRSLYWMLFKTFSATQRMIFAELFGKPLRVIHWKTDSGWSIGSDAYDQAADAAESIGAETVANMPPGAELVLMNQSQNSGQLWSMTVDQVDDQLSVMWVGTNATSKQQPGALGAGGAEVGERQQNVYERRDANGIAHRFQTQLVDLIVKLNVGPSMMAYSPRFSIRAKDEIDRVVQQQLLNGAIMIGVPVKVSEYYDKLKIEKPEGDDAFFALVGAGGAQAKIVDPQTEKKRAKANGQSDDWTPLDGTSQTTVTPTAAGIATTVNEYRIETGKGIKRLPDGRPDPDGELSIYAYQKMIDAKYTPGPAAPPGGAPPSGDEPAKEDKGPGEPKPSGAPPFGDKGPAKLEADRGAYASPYGSEDDIMARVLADGARLTGTWASAIVDAIDPDEDAGAASAALSRAVDALPMEGLSRTLERTILLGLMLGALDAQHEAEAITAESHRLGSAILSDATRVADALLLDVNVGGGGSSVGRFITKPFQGAIDWFLGKKVLAKATFDRLAGEAKRRAFTIAGLAKQSMLGLAHDELTKAIAEGSTMRDFREKLDARFESNGWTKLAPAHTELVFRNAVMGSYGAGREAQMCEPEVLAARPYWLIRGVDDGRTRHAHRAAHGKVLLAADPFWRQAVPPFGHHCFMPGTMVRTIDGERPIEQLQRGDVVLTHLGRWRRVDASLASDFGGELLTIELADGRTLRVTPNHRMLTTNRGWIEAGDLTTEDDLHAPEPEHE